MPIKSYIDMLAFDRKNNAWNVIVETPRGSRYKFKYNPANATFSLHRILPEGMSFPYDFGFLPRTRGADGDPLDVLVLLKDPTFCGCLVPARLVGVIEALQTERDGTSERNDRLVAIPIESREESKIKSAKELDDHLLGEIEGFFIAYNREMGKKFKVLAVRGPKTAKRLVEAGIRLCAKVSKN